MEQIVLLLNPCFPLVSLSGFPPPFHLPAVLVKPGPQRHLLSVTGSWAGPGSSPHLPCFAMGGRVVFWLLSGEFVLKLTYQVARELPPWLLCDPSSGTARTGGKASHVASPPKARSPRPAHQPSRLWPTKSNRPASTSSAPNCSYFPSGTGTVGTSWPTEHLGPAGVPAWGGSQRGKGGTSEKWHVPARTEHTSAHEPQPCPRVRAERPCGGGVSLLVSGLTHMRGQ